MLGIKTIAFPNICTGVYGFPKRRAAEIALNAINHYPAENSCIEKVIFVCYDEENHVIYAEMIREPER